MPSKDLNFFAVEAREREIRNFDVLVDTLSRDVGHLQAEQTATLAALRAIGQIVNGNGAPKQSNALTVLYDTGRKQPLALAQAFEIAAATLTEAHS